MTFFVREIFLHKYFCVKPTSTLKEKYFFMRKVSKKKCISIIFPHLRRRKYLKKTHKKRIKKFPFFSSKNANLHPDIQKIFGFAKIKKCISRTNFFFSTKKYQKSTKKYYLQKYQKSTVSKTDGVRKNTFPSENPPKTFQKSIFGVKKVYQDTIIWCFRKMTNFGSFLVRQSRGFQKENFLVESY